MSVDMRGFTTTYDIKAVIAVLSDELFMRQYIAYMMQPDPEGRGEAYDLGHQDGFDGIQPRSNCIDEYYTGYVDGMQIKGGWI